jgi:putative peptidoglycan lipid II flippase
MALVLFLEGAIQAWLNFFSPQLQTQDIGRLTMIMTPGLIFICLFGLFSAILQCEGRFFLVGFSPVTFNLVWIGAAFCCKDYLPDRAATLLALSIVLALAVQWLVMLPAVFRSFVPLLSWKEWLRPAFFSKEIRALIAPFLFSLLGVSAVQINSAIDSLFAYTAEAQGPAYLWFAIRIQQFPLALFAIAFSSPLLPLLSQKIVSQDEEGFRYQLQFALKKCSLFLFPATGCLFALGLSGIHLLYGRGHFDFSSVCATAICLWNYSLGLLPAAFVILLSSAFYAKKDFKTPMRASLWSMLLHLILNTLLILFLHRNSSSVALATSLSSLFNCFYLIRQLGLASWGIGKKEIAFFFKLLCATLSATLLVLFVNESLWQDCSWHLLCGKVTHAPIFSLSRQIVHFLFLLLLFIVVFVGSGYLLRLKELSELFSFLKKEKKVIE